MWTNGHNQLQMIYFVRSCGGGYSSAWKVFDRATL
uniref:Uncharacterized protein n=1 Tax=Arundo donax TaxID=35708 RepID=A0A0A9C7X4_ARUDO